nr:uncharacterized protein CTRU02_07202 [Colletotrichum truncatum]KAF6791440.1 hypothetical protein CTRU02_07202 [Colletotrichum truncatum]
MRAIFTTFAGVASHVSPQRGQQPGGKVIVHVTDLSDAGRTTRPGPWRNSALVCTC